MECSTCRRLRKRHGGGCEKEGVKMHHMPEAEGKSLYTT